MQRVVREYLTKDTFEAILCDDFYLAGNIPDGNKVPVVLNKHDITCRIMRQFAAGERNPLKKGYAALEALKIEHLESKVCASAQAVAVCSAQDGDVLRGLSPKAKMAVVPNVVDVEKYKPSHRTEGGAVLFVGAMDWLPNQDGVEFLVYEILPYLRWLAPTAQVVLAGRNPSAAMVRRFERFPDVQLTGTVADLRPVYCTRSGVRGPAANRQRHAAEDSGSGSDGKANRLNTAGRGRTGAATRERDSARRRSARLCRGGCHAAEPILRAPQPWASAARASSGTEVQHPCLTTATS